MSGTPNKATVYMHFKDLQILITLSLINSEKFKEYIGKICF